MKNIPKINLGIVAVSRDCFPIELSKKRRTSVVEECKAKNIAVTEIETIVENEKDSLKALEELRQMKINALVIFLGNFGP
ncbi:MAG: fucose isomerase, partial [Candidatus Aminicenantes bacterium]|nr:fucose isomerase [Candidatus Aminicenantes bacterium]